MISEGDSNRKAARYFIMRCFIICFFFHQVVVKMIKLRGMKWATHVAHRDGKIYKIFGSKILNRSPVHLWIYRRIILKLIKKKHDRRM